MKIHAFSGRLVLAAGLLVVVSCSGTPPGTASSFFTLVALPDTQVYADHYPELFHAQTRWIADNVERYNIEYVLHLGDITNNNAVDEWEVARAAFDRIAERVPTAISIGNHDMGPIGRASTRETLFNEYFPLAEFERLPGFAGVYDAEPDLAENMVHLLSAGGRDWMILVLEFGPRDDVLRWANEVVAAHPCRSVIVLTHAYLDQRGERYVQPLASAQYEVIHDAAGFADGQRMWRRLIRDQPNIVMVINGHFPQPPTHLASRGSDGRTVHQMMVDYQDTPRGGSGLMRLLMFQPDDETVLVRDFSPVSDQATAELGRELTIRLAPLPEGCRPTETSAAAETRATGGTGEAR